MKEIDKKYQFLSRHLAGEETQEEQQEFNRLAEENPTVKSQLVVLKAFWRYFYPTKSLTSKQNITAKVMHQVLGGYQHSRPRMKRWYAAVSILTLALASSMFWALYENGKQMEMIHYQAEVGEVKHIVLPDGTEVSLNATSSLVVPQAFEGETRQVILMGEGYFKVTKDVAHPFVIATSHMNVKVLGTQFNLKAYAQDTQITTFLDEGKVQLTGDFINQEAVFLKPGQEAILTKANGDLQIIDRPGYKSGLWRDDKLIFYNNTLLEIASILERKFDVQIIITNNELNNYKFSGDFSNAGLFELLGYLSTARSFSFEAKENAIIITK